MRQIERSPRWLAINAWVAEIVGIASAREDDADALGIRLEEMRADLAAERAYDLDARRALTEEQEP